MAPIDLRLGQNPFQVIPELSLFDIEDGKFFGFFGLDQFVLAVTHVSWAQTHVSWAKAHVSWAKTHVSWPTTHVSWAATHGSCAKTHVS